VPAGVFCVRVTVFGASRSVTSRFNVTPGQTNTVFSLGDLPLGTDSFVGDAFAAQCSAIAGSEPTWVSSPVSAFVGIAPPASVALLLTTNGHAGVSVGFEDAGAGSTGEPPNAACDDAGCVCLPGFSDCNGTLADGCETAGPCPTSDAGASPNPPATINVDTLTAFATPGFVNGGGIAARGGITYQEQFGGGDGSGSQIFRIDPSGAVNQTFITNVPSGFKPTISSTGTIFAAGNATGPTPQIVEYDSTTGALLGLRYSEAGGARIRTVAQTPSGALFFGTDSTTSGVRQVTSPSTSAMISPGIGNNNHVASLSNGTLLVGSGTAFGTIVGAAFQPAANLGPAFVTSVVVLPGDAVLVSTSGNFTCMAANCEGKVTYFSPGLSTSSDYLTTTVGSGKGGFQSLAYDAVTGEVVAVRSDGNLYRIHF
jgi:hypothetical protein